MNTITRILFGTALCASSTLFTPAARADVLGGLGRWSGSGSVHAIDGKALGDFRVELTRAAAGTGRVETRGTVTTGTGQVIPFRSLLTRTADGFVIESERGKGQGTCLDPSICHSVELDAAGNGWTTTILIDGPQRIRVLLTELEKGKPVRVIWQTLSQP
jgi:hypothetical protein